MDDARRLAGEYLYDPTFKTLRFHDNGDNAYGLSNSKGPLPHYRIMQKRGRWRFEVNDV